MNDCRLRQDTLLGALAWNCFFFNPKSFFCDQAGLVFEPTGYLV
jgi:hypothetical protein